MPATLVSVLRDISRACHCEAGFVLALCTSAAGHHLIGARCGAGGGGGRGGGTQPTYWVGDIVAEAVVN
jgi:hypothetical protein